MEALWFFVKTIFFFLLGFAILHTIVTHFILLYEMRLKYLQDGHKQQIGFLILLKSALVEIFCNFARNSTKLALILYSKIFSKLQNLKSNTEGRTTSENNTSVNKNPASGTPILLIHGYTQDQTDWVWFKHKLRKNNLGPLYSLNLKPHFASMVQLSDLLKKKIEEIKAETNNSNIILIGHSMGGLVGSYYTENLANPGEVLAVITLGAPFQGTKMVALGYGQSVKEMAPHSPFLRELTQKIKSSSIKYHHIASKIDNIIIPWDSAFPSEDYLENNLPNNQLSLDNHLILGDHGHLALLISPRVINQVVKWLKISASD